MRIRATRTSGAHVSRADAGRAWRGEGLKDVRGAGMLRVRTMDEARGRTAVRLRAMANYLEEGGLRPTSNWSDRCVEPGARSDSYLSSSLNLQGRRWIVRNQDWRERDKVEGQGRNTGETSGWL